MKRFFFIVTGSILFLGMFDRRRWAWYFGLSVFAFGSIASIVSGNYFISVAYLGFLFLLFIHKDYLNKKNRRIKVEEFPDS